MSRKIKRSIHLCFRKIFRKTPHNGKEDPDKEKMELVLRRKDELPLPLRSVIDREIARNHKKPKHFLSEVEEGVFRWIMDHQTSESINDERDTYEQVELALRLFPKVLRRRRGGHYPLIYLFCSIRSVSFVPLFAKIGTELGGFHPNERGGLVVGNTTSAFQQLAMSCRDVPRWDPDSSRHKMVDRKFLNVIKELRNENLMTQSDILEHEMIHCLCHQRVYFPKERILYLVEWDPRTLLHHDSRKLGDGTSVAPCMILSFFQRTEYYRIGNHNWKVKEPNGLEWIEILFGLLFKHYPCDLGLIFDKSDPSDELEGHSSHRGEQYRMLVSPFELACREYGTEKVLSIVNVLLHQAMQRDIHFTQKALIRLCSTRGKDGIQPIFLLLQRDPSVFQPRTSNCEPVEHDGGEPSTTA